jgi:hypothetical protein
MNNQQREKLDLVVKALNERSANLQTSRNVVEEIKDDNQSSFDNMPEGLQNGEKGELMQNAIDSLTNVEYSLDEAINAIDTAIQELEGIE